MSIESPVRDIHVSGRAVGLATLPEGDPELIEALEHAKTCVDCARQLREAQDVLAVLGALPVPPPPSPAVMRRVIESVNADVGATPAVSPAKPLLATAAAWLVFALAAKQHAWNPLAWIESFATLAVAAACIVAVPRLRGRVVLVSAFVSALLVLAASGGSVDGGLVVRIGIKCVVIELLAAALPYAALAHAVIVKKVPANPAMFAGIAAAGALAGQAALHISCPVRTAMPHLLVFHLGGVLLAAMVGALCAGRVIRTIRPLG